MVECLDDFEAQFLALLGGEDGDVFDVADEAEVVYAVAWVLAKSSSVGWK